MGTGGTRRGTSVGLAALLAGLAAAAPAADGPPGPEEAVARGCLFAFYPSDRLIVARIEFTRETLWTPEAVAFAGTIPAVEIWVQPAGGSDRLAGTTVSLRGGRSGDVRLDLPELDGRYEICFRPLDTPRALVVRKPFERLHYPWENNRLGLTDEVYPPFEPVGVDGAEVAVVGRRYRMNAFGLWDSVVTQGRELLAGPMRVRYLTGDGEGAFPPGRVEATARRPNAAVFSARSDGPAVSVRTRSTVEHDGCMRVETTLAPGRRPAELLRLWVDIPLKDAETPLMHQIGDTLRNNYSGAVPRGEGVVWDSTQARRLYDWRNAWNSYVFLGGGERGLAWFADNDKGWITAKDDFSRPLVEIAREGSTLTLRVLLINTPATLTEPRTLVFGLQASPTKPMPGNWRAGMAGRLPHGGPVVPWGGIHCPHKGPHRDDWRIVDKIIEAQKTGVFDEAWFSAYAETYRPPPVFGNWPWLTSVRHFAGRRARPAMAYTEEMMSDMIKPEWRTFMDEWDTFRFTRRRAYDDETVRQNGAGRDWSRPTCFNASYINYGVWFQNEWLRRGISIYWDNTYPKIGWDPHTCDAYALPDGRTQPAMTLWGERAYAMRTYNLLEHWRRHQPDPIHWTMHMTNTLMLPVHTWATGLLDYELWSGVPYEPDALLVQSSGRHVGCYVHAHMPLTGNNNPLLEGRGHTRGQGSDAGLRCVYEIVGTHRRLAPFGYGEEGVDVHTYWADRPAAGVDNDRVKWLVLGRPEQETVHVLLASWSPDTETPRVHLDPAVLGFEPGPSVTDAETGRAIESSRPGVFRVDLHAPYGHRVVRVGPRAAGEALR